MGGSRKDMRTAWLAQLHNLIISTADTILTSIGDAGPVFTLESRGPFRPFVAASTHIQILPGAISFFPTNTTLETFLRAGLFIMCFSCSGWPWSQAAHLAAPPAKEEHIFLDSSYDFYPDYRKVSEESSFAPASLFWVSAACDFIFHLFPQISLPSTSISSTPAHHHQYRQSSLSIKLPIDTISTTMTEPYYDYKSNPVVKNEPGRTWHTEQPSDWPKTFDYISNIGLQGLHPPAPIYQTNQPAQQNMYYFQVSLAYHLTSSLLTSWLGQQHLSWRLLCQRSLLWDVCTIRASRLALLFSFIFLLLQPSCFYFSHMLQLHEQPSLHIQLVIQLPLQLLEQLAQHLLTILHSPRNPIRLPWWSARCTLSVVCTIAMGSTFTLVWQHSQCTRSCSSRRQCRSCSSTHSTLLLCRLYCSRDAGSKCYHRRNIWSAIIIPKSACALQTGEYATILVQGA